VAITFHPKVGQILLCDFSEGFREPEMVKSGRPVLVIAPSIKGRHPCLVTVVALSSVEPTPVMAFHLKLPKACLPQLGNFQEKDTWVKGDMVYSLGFHRLDLIQLGKRDQSGKRVYFQNCLSRERMREVYTCILHGMNLGAMAEHIPP
jgi:uncharacterized protein YifN (PemK superfamily)